MRQALFLIGFILLVHINKAETQVSSLIYLQPNKSLFVVGETLWFKGYALDAHSLEPFQKDTTLFVQLMSMDVDRKTYSQEMIPLFGGFGSGYIELYPQIPSGDYYLMGFTSHSADTSQLDFSAYRRIRILPRPDPQTGLWEISSKNSSELNKKPDARISFYPEGGHLVDQISTTVGVKIESSAPEYDLRISGWLLENDKPILPIQTNSRGLGKFQLIPQAGASYRVEMNDEVDQVDFPQVHASGITLNLMDKSADTLTFSGAISPEFAVNGQVLISIQHRGARVAIHPVKINPDHQYTFKLPTANLPEGLLEVTVHDTFMQPYCERLVYVNSHKRLEIQAVLTDSVFHPGDLVRIELKTQDYTGEPTMAHVGLTVWDGYYAANDGLDIQSYTHLQSQLNQNLSFANYYYADSDSLKSEALDLALLTLGWRAYIWNNVETEISEKSNVLLKNFFGGYIDKTTELPPMLYTFEPEAALSTNVVAINPDRSFQFTFESLHQNLNGNYFYVKPLGDEEVSKKSKLVIENPFDLLDQMKGGLKLPNLPFGNVKNPSEVPSRPRINDTQVLEEVFVKAGPRARFYEDLLMKNLDSLTKFTSDYVGQCGWINCMDCIGGTKPNEGGRYPRYTDGTIPRHGAIIREYTTEPYQYPEYTDEQLLKMFNIYRVPGYQPEKRFYEPAYTDVNKDELSSDFRTTLIWRPEIITDENGKAYIEFYTSSLTGTFTGRVEGVSAEGLIGGVSFEIVVLKK